MPRVNNINIVDGVIAYSNFSGRINECNENGNRTVTFVIPDDIAQDLINDGWNIRLQLPKNDDENPRYLLEVTMSFRTKDGRPKDPKVFIVREDNSIVHMTEETIGTLDGKDIISADAVIGPWYWERNGRSGIKAYINSLYLKIKENPIDAKYRPMIDRMNNSFVGTNDLDLPFPIE